MTFNFNTDQPNNRNLCGMLAESDEITGLGIYAEFALNRFFTSAATLKFFTSAATLKTAAANQQCYFCALKIF
jgi:hypothetical protein